MPKVTVCIDKDEWYPVFEYDAHEALGTKVEVDIETLDRWMAAFNEFRKVQDEMYKVLEAAEPKPQPATK